MNNVYGTGNRRLAVLLVLCLAVSAWGCKKQEAGEERSEDRLKIVCTIFPACDWVKQILGDQTEQAELTLLMKNGADLHSYQPTVWDMQKIADADLFVYVGGESDFWVEAALRNGKNPDRVSLNLMEVLEDFLVEETHVEGIQSGHVHDHVQEEAEEDEHVWLSLRNAEAACQALTEALCGLDEASRDRYRENSRNYLEKLGTLDRSYEEAVRQVQEPVLLFGDRFPFQYLAKDYGITCYAAFAGCSAETEASFSVITFLADKVNEYGLSAVLAIDGSDQKIARTVAGNTRTKDQKVLVLDSMQSVSGADIEQGADYLSIMEQNLEVLKEALGVQGGE